MSFVCNSDGELTCRVVKVYDDGRTKQAFKDSTDINKLVARGAIQEAKSHLEKFQPVYGDFSDFDFQIAHEMIARGKSIFAELPSEVRREFNQSPREFFAFVNDPANVNKLGDVLPELAAPGRQRIVLNAAILSSANAVPPEAAAEEAAAPVEPPGGVSTPPESPAEG